MEDSHETPRPSTAKGRFSDISISLTAEAVVVACGLFLAGACIGDGLSDIADAVRVLASAVAP